MSPNRLCSCPCHFPIKPKIMLLHRQTEISLYIIKFSLAKYRLRRSFAAWFQEQQNTVDYPKFLSFINLWASPNTSLCWIVTGTSKETVQDTEALENSMHKSECLHKKTWTENRTVIFSPAFITLLLCNYFCKAQFPVGKADVQPQVSLYIYSQRSACMLWVCQLRWTWFQRFPLLCVWSETSRLNSSVLPLNWKWRFGSEVFQKISWQCDHNGSCDCSTSLRAE